MLNIHRGRASEFLAIHILETHDIRAVHVDMDGDDLWVKNPKEQLYRCQVKSCAKPTPVSYDRPRQPRYQYQLKNSQEYEGVFLLVAADIKLIIARTWDDIACKVLKLNPNVFTEAKQTSSIKGNFNL